MPWKPIHSTPVLEHSESVWFFKIRFPENVRELAVICCCVCIHYTIIFHMHLRTKTSLKTTGKKWPFFFWFTVLRLPLHGVAVGLLLSHIIQLGVYVVPLDNFKAIIVSIILLVLPLSSNIVDFILPGWRQIYIATAQNWPVTWQTRPTETSEMVIQLYLHTLF